MTHSSPGARRAAGFTLIELMITVAIVGILAAVALPVYRDAVLKGKRAQGRTALLEMAQAQERWFTANNSYQLIATAGASVTGFKTFSGDNPSSAAYKLTVTNPCPGLTAQNPERQCVVITAVPQMADPQAGNLTMTSTGTKACDGSKQSVCWP